MPYEFLEDVATADSAFRAWGEALEVLQQNNRQNHCTIVEIWQGRPALEAHVMEAHTRQCRDKFQPISGSLYDERLYKALD